MAKTESWKEKDLIDYCKANGYPVDWYVALNNILWEHGFDNYHLREHHAVPEILNFIGSLIMKQGIPQQMEAPQSFDKMILNPLKLMKK